MTFSLRILTLCFILSVISQSRAAIADDTMDAALASFEEGVSLFNSGKFQTAADTFRRAYELKPSWKLLFNIGQSEAAARRYGLALEAFEQFLSEGGDEITEDRRDQVLAEVVRLRKMVGYLKVNAPEGTVIFIDNLKRATAPVNTLLPISAGLNHGVRGERDGAAVYAESFKVIGGQTMTVEMNRTTDFPGAADEAIEDLPPTQESNRAGNDVVETKTEPKKFPFFPIGWALGGTGAAAAIAGGVIGGIALSKNNAVADKCAETGCPDAGDDKNKYQTMGTVSTALLAAGGTVLASGIALLIVGKLKMKKTKETSAVSAAVFPDNNGAMTAVSFRF